MVRLSEDSVEKVIRENIDKFAVYSPAGNHGEKFLFKLNLRIRKFISIVPHLVRVIIATAVIFAASAFVWKNYISKESHVISIKNKITAIVGKIL
jgi:hypothetical protein